MKNTMKAWVLTAPKNLEQQRVDIPVPKQDEVLVEVQCACLCNGSDPGIYNGHEAYQTPMIFGHEASGVIVKAGEAVTEFQVGDRVCFWCAMGGFAEYQAVSPTAVAMFQVPKAVSLAASPILELTIASCRALMAYPATEQRKSLTICGLGPSGLVLLQYARLLGYQRIVGWDLYADRRALAKELGADEVYDSAEIGGISAMLPTDISVDMMGDERLPQGDTFTQLLRATVPGGTVVSYGHPENGRRFSPYVFQSRNLTLVGPVNDLEIIRQKGKVVMEALESGTMRVEPLITHYLKFSDIGGAFQQLLRQPEKQIKVIFTFEKENEQ